ncbi:MAG: GFA family protein [SAR324 cluster bacterium]|nr:GFA family protein [SAR324 cluster bacterium]
MSEFTGSCHCGEISYTFSGEPLRQVNCHCKNCRKTSGGPYLANIFVSEDNLLIKGSPKVYQHLADSGNQMTKKFCGNCGAQMFSLGSGRPGIVIIRSGTIDNLEIIQPTLNIFVSSKIPSTPLDESLSTFEKMPS